MELFKKSLVAVVIAGSLMGALDAAPRTRAAARAETAAQELQFFANEDAAREARQDAARRVAAAKAVARYVGSASLAALSVVGVHDTFAQGGTWARHLIAAPALAVAAGVAACRVAGLDVVALRDRAIMWAMSTYFNMAQRFNRID